MDTQLLYKVCRMYYLDNLTQQNIGDRLGISRMRVARLLHYAREHQLIEFKLNFPLQEGSRVEWELEQRFGLNECVVVPSSRQQERTIEELAAALGRLLNRSLTDGMVIGVSWGRTLEGISRYLSLEYSRNVKVVPIVGGVGIEGSSSSTNYITRNFAESMGGLNYTINVPAVVDSRRARDVLEEDGNTRKIAELAGKAHILLMGMSNATKDSTLGRTGYFSDDELAALHDAGVVGNVNLVFLNREGKRVPNEVEERMVRILPPRLMKQVAVRIGVAFGQTKIEIIASALKGGWINTLITDEDTARAVLGRALTASRGT
jgi:deoxyribonucleoside regulator